MKKPVEVLVPAMSGKAFVAARGETVRIVDVEGGQPGDLVAFNADDPGERFSQARTRVENRKTKATAGDRLWTNALPPRVMFTITRDTCGAHDLLYLPCCRWALEARFGVARDGCHEHLVEALKPWGIGARDLPEPLNLFFHVVADGEGAIRIGEQRSRPGDLIELRAEMDCVVAVSTCSVPRAGGANSGYRVEIV